MAIVVALAILIAVAVSGDAPTTVAEGTATRPSRTPTAPRWWDMEASGQWLADAIASQTPAPTATPSRRPSPRQLPRTAPPRTSAPKTSHSIRGKASWYCRAGVSPCHHRYPPGSMVAAACHRLRAAMGPGWRGRQVVVRASSGQQVTVRLVDRCRSRTKLIDLYWEPMRRLGGSGVLDVRVRW